MGRRQSISENPLDAIVLGEESIRAEKVEASQAPGREAASDAPPEPEIGERGANLSDGDKSTEEAREAIASSQCLTFFLGGEEYAVSVLQIKEIFEFNSLTRVPTTPTWIRGVMNLRGSVVPVVDLAVKFGFPETRAGKQTCVLIAEVNLGGEQSVMGVMVDSVSRVTDWTREDIERSPAFGAQVRVDCLLGMGKLGEKFVPILDINRVLSADELLTAAAAPSINAERIESDDRKDARGERGRLEEAAEEVGNHGGVDTGATG